MDGYTPGEQPKDKGIIKLNTNENPYPPSPGVQKALSELDFTRLRLYPDPVGTELRKAIAKRHGLEEKNVILGNGSDDILSMIFNAFAGENDLVASIDPSYSLYPVLAEIQGAAYRKIPLNNKDFSLAANSAATAADAKLFLLARPNAPTGNCFPKEDVAALCEDIPGIVVIDEAYADFARDNCADFVNRYPNVIISRTFSKSYSLAGLRFGYALASEEIIAGLMKVKDSYNVNWLTQLVALAAWNDKEDHDLVVKRIKKTRGFLIDDLSAIGFNVLPSEANFVFASPPDGNGKGYFDALREQKIFVRYFPGKLTGKYVRITVGTSAEMKRLMEVTRSIYEK
ncbi:MAG: histidinol-phosphate transaminase [Lentisphaerae bacterium GWF2_52_8]|nr:MAG: histidinol-phosphate transaminase [Lentisphaerae bacterium GWF2_52_8]